MNDLKPIYAKVSFYKTNEDIPASSTWDYELLKVSSYNNFDLKIGGIVKNDNGDDLEITDIQFEILKEENDNKKGFDIAQKGIAGINNTVVKIFVNGL